MHAVVITGPPASGKSSLAAHLAKALRSPLIAKDAIKESLFDSLGYADQEWSQKLGAASYDMLFTQAESMFTAQIPCVLLEANFTERAGAKLQTLAEQYSVKLVQIFCCADTEVLWQRFQGRATSGQRHPGHSDATNLKEAQARFFHETPRPLNLRGMLIEVETTDFAKINYHAIAETIRQNLT